jgi:Fungal specific transcription factor domain
MYGQVRSRSHSNLFAPNWTESPQASIHEASFSDPHGTHLSPALPEDINNVETAQAFSGDPDLPPADMLFSLVDLYFLHINQWFPLLERRTTVERLFGSTPWTASDRILLHAITATTIRFSTDHRLNESTRQQYHRRSKQKVLLYGMENFSVGALKALVIIALNFIGTRNGGPGLNLLALITRSVVQLGLCKETYSSPVLPAYSSNSTLGISVLPAPRDWIEDEGRRRLFWLVYILDRDATVATAFDFALDEKDIDRKLPCKDELYVLNNAVETKWFQTADRSKYSIKDPGTLGSLSYLVELKGLLTKIHLFLRRPVDIGAMEDVEEWQKTYRQLDLALREWRQNLPGEFRSLEWIKNPGRNARQVDCGWILLQATYYT